MKSRIIRSVLLLAYIGLAMSGHFGSLQSATASDTIAHSAPASMMQAVK